MDNVTTCDNRVVVVTNELPPYRRALIDSLCRLKPDWDVSVLLATGRERGRTWQPVSDTRLFRVEVVCNVSVPLRRAHPQAGTTVTTTGHLPLGLMPALIKIRPNAVVSTGFGVPSLLATLYRTAFPTRLTIWSGETIRHGASVTFLQRSFRRVILRCADSFLAYGKAAVDYLTAVGIPEERISCCTQVVDNRWWSEQVGEARRMRADIRKRLDLRGRVALYVGQLVHRKGVQNLVRAWANLPEAFRDSNSLLIVGGGPETDLLRRAIARHSLSTVCLAGPQPPEALPEYYAVADLLVLPSLLEVWGLVVNEAMAAGIPVLVSKNAGCAEELVVEDLTGSTFDPHDAWQLCDLLKRWILQGPMPPVPAVQDHIATWNFESGAGAIVTAIGLAISRGTAREERACRKS